MIIETSAGKQFEARFFTTLTQDGNLMINIIDSKRKLSRMAEDFEGLDYVSCEEGGVRFEGYNQLRSISRLDKSTIQLRLAKEE